MSHFTKSKLLIFLFGLAIGFGLFLWTASGPCYNTASIFSFFTSKFAPCNAQTLSRQSKKDASLVLVPSPTTVRVGQSFVVTLIVNPEGIAINAVGVKINNTTSTSLISKDESMSPFLLHLTDPTASSDLKRVVQVTPNPGIAVPTVIAKFTFTAVTLGTTTISISTSSLILANDGFGTDVLGSVQNATVNVAP